MTINNDQRIPSKVLKYFLGNPPIKLNYTILGFQKTIDSSDDIKYLESVGIKGLDRSKENYMSYFLSFNHERGLIDFFLINYGAPYKLKLTDIPVEYLNGLESSSELGFNRHDVYQDVNLSVTTKFEADTIKSMSLADGKLSSNFFKVFYTGLVMFSNFPLWPHEVSDMRYMTYILLNNRNRRYPDKTISREMYGSLLSTGGLLDSISPFIAHGPKRFVNTTIGSELNNLLGGHLVLTSIPKIDEPGVIKDVRAEFNGKKFKGYSDLQGRIKLFNTQLRSKYGEYFFPRSRLVNHTIPIKDLRRGYILRIVRCSRHWIQSFKCEP